MQTKCYKVDPETPEASVIAEAAALIRKGEVVAFPTETVYGLGADAFNEEAVCKIFIAKGRQPDNPLIVHISNMSQVSALIKSVPDEARLLMDRFWPGPLTLVMESLPSVASAARAGGNTVGVRMPRHPVALALIDEAGPLAAPSANLSGRPSPTTPEHVKNDLDGRISAILDAGPTGMGIESTVLDMTQKPFRILRPGGISLEELEEVLPGMVETAEAKGPADRYPHYQTRARVILLSEPADVASALHEYKKQGKKVGLVAHSYEEYRHIEKESDLVYWLPPSAEEAGKRLYAVLRDADQRGLDILFFEPYPEEGKGSALMYRLKKSSQRLEE
ncbi:MAG TPA: threonylcarbamoyl-AMP synthase [Syntrophothermus lipocalidus]|nr:L-threonylcarbamoyladenylate synthase [Syntrophothermus lipocalidus]HHV76270.1 threonylcarbamoyl-AMP synthase [Syntrophothermus lipocalidus]HOV42313.1 L-threonylcarbamoyladenylate synthase [Syntrophothermus lipocalidus]